MYLFFQKKILENVDNIDNEISRSKAIEILRMTYRIPKPILDSVLKEMEHMGLVELCGYNKIRVVNLKRCDILNDMSKVNQMVGMW